MWLLLTWSECESHPTSARGGSPGTLVRRPLGLLPPRSLMVPSVLPTIRVGWLLALCGHLPGRCQSLCVSCPPDTPHPAGVSRDARGGVAVWSPALESEQLGWVLWLCYILNFSFPHLGCGERTWPTSQLHRNSCENLNLRCTQNTRCSWQPRRQ